MGGPRSTRDQSVIMRRAAWGRRGGAGRSRGATGCGVGQTVSLMSPACEQSPELKGACIAAVLSDFKCFYVIMFFRKDRPKTEGSRYADHRIKT